MRYCFCVLGWYFYEDFFAELSKMPGDRYIVSHRSQEWLDEHDLPDGVRDNLYVFPNAGLDWGLYYQFKEAIDVHAYDFVICVHDDVVIKDRAFPERLTEMFEDPKIKVIGNGRNGTDWEFPFAKYGDRMPWDEEDDFMVRTVRGSFFALRSSVFETIGNFPVFWKAGPGARQNKGNYSLRNFGYVITKNFGAEAISYLDWDHYLDTPYLSELVRGERAPAAS